MNGLALQKECYHQVKSTQDAQMTISAIRLVAGASWARANGKLATRPFPFKKTGALFLVGKRGCDVDLRKHVTLSIWTVGGRKSFIYTVPTDFQAILSNGVEIDRLIYALQCR